MNNIAHVSHVAHISHVAQWKELMNNRYGASGRNTVVNENIRDLNNMKKEIDDKINNIRGDRLQNLNLLKKEMSARLYQFQTELNDMKKEIADKMKEKKEDTHVREGKYLRRNKRKYGDV